MARILLVDDEEPVRGLLRRGLEMDGHEVTVAFDGGDGLDRLDEAPRRLRSAHHRHPHADHGRHRPCAGGEAGLSADRDPAHDGFADQRERTAGLDRIVADVLTKPFSLADLRATVARVLPDT